MCTFTRTHIKTTFLLKMLPLLPMTSGAFLILFFFSEEVKLFLDPGHPENSSSYNSATASLCLELELVFLFSQL